MIFLCNIRTVSHPQTFISVYVRTKSTCKKLLNNSIWTKSSSCYNFMNVQWNICTPINQIFPLSKLVSHVPQILKKQCRQRVGIHTAISRQQLGNSIVYCNHRLAAIGPWYTRGFWARNWQLVTGDQWLAIKFAVSSKKTSDFLQFPSLVAKHCILNMLVNWWLFLEIFFVKKFLCASGLATSVQSLFKVKHLFMVKHLFKVKHKEN